ncbi:FAD-dependent monooxygenase [Streptomyces sp. SP18CS02]|uniref:FAD-dependent monooxygenase n=1 Tax=Streptomyces sp. SP18CS02 TaxID=3002531 RepID=UPI002E78444A|nr:FAD-dependent monooxygenase [Streptomyces sp. SP18CS02]MEE1753176.1 FAD-dependent monooxygenase [Streptomyces sp. SP18CS02]
MTPWSEKNSPRILIAGAGIGGLTTALSLHAAGLDDIVLVEACPRLRAVGAGINLQPAAVRELTELGLGDALAAEAVATARLEYHHRYGGEIWSEPRGLAAGYRWPQYSVHRGRLQELLLAEVTRRLGPGALMTGRRLARYEQRYADGHHRVWAYTAGDPEPISCDLLIGADGINSAVRAAMYPDEGPPLGNGICMWRGLSEGPPFLDGRTMVILGCNSRVKAVVYPVRPPDASGTSTLNWVVETRTIGTPAGTVAPVTRRPSTRTTGPRTFGGAPASRAPAPVADGSTAAAGWDSAVPPSTVLPHLEGWHVPFLDLRATVAAAPRVLRYPMIDRDPLPSWVDGRVVLLGDAAHPMYPTGSNGASQAIVDARVLAYLLAHHDPDEALARYDATRRPETTRLLAAHRRLEPDPLLHQVESLAPDGFRDIRDILPDHKLAEIRSCTRQVTGVDAAGLNARSSWNVPARTASACAWPLQSG